MAFTGTAVVKKVAENLYRVTGLSLAAAAAGTIGLEGGTGEVDLSDGSDNWKEYDDVTLQDAVQVLINPVDNPQDLTPIRVVKTGTDNTDFLITLTNDGAAASPELEIYIRFH